MINVYTGVIVYIIMSSYSFKINKIMKIHVNTATAGHGAAPYSDNILLIMV